MGSLKHLRNYFFWTILSLFLGVVYVSLILGNIPADESFGGAGFVLKVFYVYGLALVGLPVGVTIAILFIITDMLYLRKRLKNNSKEKPIRMTVLFLITAFVALVHYMLEKVIDVI